MPWWAYVIIGVLAFLIVGIIAAFAVAYTLTFKTKSAKDVIKPRTTLCLIWRWLRPMLTNCTDG